MHVRLTKVLELGHNLYTACYIQTLGQSHTVLTFCTNKMSTVVPQLVEELLDIPLAIALGPAVAFCWIYFNEEKRLKFSPILSLEKRHKLQGWSSEEYGGLVWIKYGSLSKTTALQGRCDVTYFHGAWCKYFIGVFTHTASLILFTNSTLNSLFPLHTTKNLSIQATTTERPEGWYHTICLAIPELLHRWTQ